MSGGFTFYLSTPRFVQPDDFSARNYAFDPDSVLKQIDIDRGEVRTRGARLFNGAGTTHRALLICCRHNIPSRRPPIF